LRTPTKELKTSETEELIDGLNVKKLPTITRKPELKGNISHILIKIYRDSDRSTVSETIGLVNA
jgi:hypothetical protein